jgi:hypothetical protein
MKRTLVVVALLLAVTDAPADAFMGSAVSALSYAEQKAFNAFMRLQLVQEIAVLKQNYEASVRYYNEFKQLNSGRGLAQNVAAQIKTTQKKLDESFKSQFQETFVQNYNSNTAVDQFFHSLDQAVASNIRYVGDEAANLISNRKLGETIANNAQGLSPKDAGNLAAKAHGVQIQMMAQLHEDNLRLIQLTAMQLAGNARQENSQSRLIESLRRGVKKRAPGFREEKQGGAQ